MIRSAVSLGDKGQTITSNFEDISEGMKKLYSLLFDPTYKCKGNQRSRILISYKYAELSHTIFREAIISISYLFSLLVGRASPSRLTPLWVIFFRENCGTKADNRIKIIFNNSEDKSMKENKTVQIKFRLTESQKKQVEEYAAAAGLNVSEVMRLALQEFFNSREEKR